MDQVDGTEERMAELAAACLEVLDALLRPRRAEDEAAIEDLLASGVDAARVDVLYRLTGEDYVSGASFEQLSVLELETLDKKLRVLNTYVLERSLKRENAHPGWHHLAQIADFCLLLKARPWTELLQAERAWVQEIDFGDTEALLLNATSALQEIQSQRAQRQQRRHNLRFGRAAPIARA